jgi:hypothetical protein
LDFGEPTVIIFTAGYEFENDKMIGGQRKPAVKVHITTGLWLELTVSAQSQITAGSSQEPTLMWCYYCRF